MAVGYVLSLCDNGLDRVFEARKTLEKGCVEGLRCLQPSHRLGNPQKFENQIRRTGIVPTCGQPACFLQPSFAPAKERLKKRTRNKEDKRDPDEAQPAIVSVGGRVNKPVQRPSPQRSTSRP